MTAAAMLTTGILIASILGCASWRSEVPVETPKGQVSTAEPNPDSVDIETVLVRFTAEQLGQLEDAWKGADESFLPLENRQLLDTNGVRVGILRGELPKGLADQLAYNHVQQQSDVLEQAGLGSDATPGMRLLRCRAGRRKELVVRQSIQGPLSILTSFDGQLSGSSFDQQPTALFALTVFPATDGKAVLELLPEVQHGQQRTSYVTTEFGVRQEAKRESTIWKPLKIRATLSPGNVLIVSATQPTKSLGGSFFVTDTAKQTHEHLVLLLRLKATQLDDLFDDERIGAARALMEQ